MRLRIIYILLGVCLLAFVSCGKDETPDAGRKQLLLVYVGGDNNLASTAQRKITALCEGWDGSANRTIVVYADIKGESPSLSEIVRGSDGVNTLKTLSVYDPENSASPAVLSRIITDVAKLYPAQSYGLLLFSHASGWLPQGALENPYAATRSIVVDGRNEMALTDFVAAIPDGLFDYIVFEACFMAGIEVAYELRHKTSLILASSAEILDPGFTPVYTSSVGELLSGRVTAFGQRVFDHVLTYGEDYRNSATYSVIRTAGLDALAAFVRENCDWTKETDITDIQHFDRYSYRLFFDFEDYYSRLLDTEAQRTELSRLIGECVGWKAAATGFMTQLSGYNGFEIHRHSGLTTYIPQAVFPELNGAYEALEWKKNTTK